MSSTGTAPSSGPPRAFYTLASSAYALGLVGLINSLRLVGHDEPIFVLDCGLTEPQRRLLSAEATIVQPPAPIFPPLAKAVAPLLHPARELVLIDCDVIVTRPLGSLFEESRGDSLVAFADPVTDRFFPAWSGLLGLPEQTPAKRHPYVNTGVLALGEGSLPILEEFEELRPLVHAGASYIEGASSADPFYYADQDLFNAIFGARLDAERLVVHEQRLAPHPQFHGLEPTSRGLRCTYSDGVEPFVLHHTHTRKPWLYPTRATVYTQLLSRLLVGPGLALEPPVDWVPLRLREGTLATAARFESGVLGRIAENRGRLGLRRWLSHRLHPVGA